MSYLQLFGHQGISIFKLIYAQDGTDVFPADSENDYEKEFNHATIYHTSPPLILHPQFAPIENWRGQSYDIGGGYTVKLTLEIYNVLEQAREILKLFYYLNLIKQNPFVYQLKIFPLYSNYENASNFSFLGTLSSDLEIDNVKKFINTAQKITLSFNSEDIVSGLPYIAPEATLHDNFKPINNGDIRDVDDYEHEDIGELERPPTPSYDEIPKYLIELFNLPEPEPGE